MSDSLAKSVAKKSIPRIIIKIVTMILAMFAVGTAMSYFSNRELKAENRRLETVNAAMADTMRAVIDTAAVALSELSAQNDSTTLYMVISDSLRKETGKIEYRTLTRTVTVYRDGAPVEVDVEVEVPVVTIDGVPVPIPVVVAEELQACRRTTDECAKLQAEVDTIEVAIGVVLSFVPTVIDSLNRQIEVQDEIINGGKWNLGFIKLPKAKGQCGIYGGYRITGGSGFSESIDQTIDDVQIQASINDSYSRWIGMVGCGFGFTIWNP